MHQICLGFTESYFIGEVHDFGNKKILKKSGEKIYTNYSLVTSLTTLNQTLRASNLPISTKHLVIYSTLTTLARVATGIFADKKILSDTQATYVFRAFFLHDILFETSLTLFNGIHEKLYRCIGNGIGIFLGYNHVLSQGKRFPSARSAGYFINSNQAKDIIKDVNYPITLLINALKFNTGIITSLPSLAVISLFKASSIFNSRL